MRKMLLIFGTIYFAAGFLGGLFGTLLGNRIADYLNAPSPPTAAQVARMFARAHCGAQANIDEWATCAARENDLVHDLFGDHLESKN